jgi:hypothetical protein
MQKFYGNAQKNKRSRDWEDKGKRRTWRGRRRWEGASKKRKVIKKEKGARRSASEQQK